MLWGQQEAVLAKRPQRTRFLQVCGVGVQAEGAAGAEGGGAQKHRIVQTPRCRTEGKGKVRHLMKSSEGQLSGEDSPG